MKKIVIAAPWGPWETPSRGVLRRNALYKNGATYTLTHTLELNVHTLRVYARNTQTCDMILDRTYDSLGDAVNGAEAFIQMGFEVEKTPEEKLTAAEARIIELELKVEEQGDKIAKLEADRVFRFQIGQRVAIRASRNSIYPIMARRIRNGNPEYKRDWNGGKDHDIWYPEANLEAA